MVNAANPNGKCVCGANPSTPTPIVPTTPPGGPTSAPGCSGSKPADQCTSLLLRVNAQCINGQWDFDEQLCNRAGRVETCGGKQYCCPVAAGNWTTDMTKCKVPTVTKVPTSTPVMDKCTECPSDFKCYVGPGSEYRWFVTGYVMDGFSETEVINEMCGGKSRPVFLGKSKGDATCDGLINMDDYSLWYKVFQDGNGTQVSKSWHADFTGTDGKCDGIVNMYDYSLWYQYFNDLN